MLINEIDSMYLSLAIVGGLLLFILTFTLLGYLHKLYRKSTRGKKLKSVQHNMKATRTKKSVIPPAGSKVYLFDKQGNIIHCSLTRLTRAEIKNLGGDGTIIAMNEKIAKLKWHNMFGNQSETSNS